MISELPILSRDDVALSTSPDPRRRLPPWLRRQVPTSNSDNLTSRVIEDLRLETVCESAKCPNRMECWSQKTATFMILGNVCTRPCGFCSVPRGRPEEIELDEPARVAEAAARLGLAHVVITSVTRDDLPDGGAEHFYQCVLAVRERTGAAVEVLTPDFVSGKPALDRVVEAAPEVFNHNTETVPRLYRDVRGRERLPLDARFAQTREGTQSGDQNQERFDARPRRNARRIARHARRPARRRLDLLTLGQYLQPTPEQLLPVVRYVPPEEFDELGRWRKQWVSSRSPAARSCEAATTPARWQVSRSGYEVRSLGTDGMLEYRTWILPPSINCFRP